MEPLSPDRMKLFQHGRLVDVLLYGPFLIWLGATDRYRLPSLVRLLLLGGGLATIVSNYRNYWLVDRVWERQIPPIELLGLSGL
jgi:hypothetical protein